MHTCVEMYSYVYMNIKSEVPELRKVVKHSNSSPLGNAERNTSTMSTVEMTSVSTLALGERGEREGEGRYIDSVCRVG
jgi:hypothetical protein